MEIATTSAHRKVTPKNKSGGEKEMVRRVDEFVGEAIERERRNELIFAGTRDKAQVTANICRYQDE